MLETEGKSFEFSWLQKIREMKSTPITICFIIYIFLKVVIFILFKIVSTFIIKIMIIVLIWGYPFSSF